MAVCPMSGRLPREVAGLLKARIVAGVLGALFASPLAAQDLAIQHQNVDCLVAGQYPLIDACFSPAERLARARVYFHGEGRDWYYVDMKAEGTCHRGVLPRPKKSLRSVSYYIAATDREFAESRTEEFAPAVVDGKEDCQEGLVAPFVTSASVLVGALSGAAVPAGFVGGGILAGTAAVVGVVGAGAAAGAVITGGGEEQTTTTTTTTAPRPRPTPGPTPTPGPPPTPVPTPSPTPTPGSCLAGDSGVPDVSILAPGDNEDVGAVVTIVVEATDPGPVSSGIETVEITADEQGGSRTDAIATLSGPGPLYEAIWMIPPCIGPQDRWYIDVEATDHCGRVESARVRVMRRLQGCAPGPTEAAAEATLVWTSDLAVAGGRGQVVVNGAQAVFPGPGREDLRLAVREGRNRVEATLVSGRGPGLWRFALASGAVEPASLRIVTGEVAAFAADAIAFRLGGRPGERVVFTFDREPLPRDPASPLRP